MDATDSKAQKPPAAIARKKSLPTIADIAGVWVGDQCWAVAMVFSSPAEARYAAGNFGITIDDRAALRSLAEFPRFPDRAYWWTQICGADRSGEQLFAEIRNTASKIRFAADPCTDILDWHRRIKAEFLGWFTITAFFAAGDPVGWIPDESVATGVDTPTLEDRLEDNSRGSLKEGEDHLFYVGLNPEIVMAAVRLHIAPVGFLLSAGEVGAALTGTQVGQKPVDFVSRCKTVSSRSRSYSQKTKQLSPAQFRLLSHSTFARYDTIGYGEIPGAIDFEPRISNDLLPGFLIAPPPDVPCLLARHLLLPRDGGSSVDEILYAGRRAVKARRHQSAGDEVWTGEGILEDQGENGFSRAKLIGFFSDQLFDELLASYYDGRLKAHLDGVAEFWAQSVSSKVDLGCRFYGADREVVLSLNIGEPELPSAMEGRWLRAELNGERVVGSPGANLGEENIYLALEADGELLPTDLRWMMINCDASLLLRAMGEARVSSLLSNPLRRLEQQFLEATNAYICKTWQTPARFLGTLIRVRFTHGGETDFRIAETLEKTCEALQRSFCRMLASFAPRCALENISILSSCGDPPYPVAVWTEEWLQNSLRKFLRSHGKRLFRQLLSKDGAPFSSRMRSFNEKVR